jgi:hypothetical protein
MYLSEGNWKNKGGIYVSKSGADLLSAIEQSLSMRRRQFICVAVRGVFNHEFDARCGKIIDGGAAFPISQQMINRCAQLQRQHRGEANIGHADSLKVSFRDACGFRPLFWRLRRKKTVENVKAFFMGAIEQK